MIDRKNFKDTEEKAKQCMRLIFPEYESLLDAYYRQNSEDAEFKKDTAQLLKEILANIEPGCNNFIVNTITSFIYRNSISDVIEIYK